LEVAFEVAVESCSGRLGSIEPGSLHRCFEFPATHLSAPPPQRQTKKDGGPTKQDRRHITSPPPRDLQLPLLRLFLAGNAIPRPRHSFEPLLLQLFVARIALAVRAVLDTRQRVIHQRKQR